MNRGKKDNMTHRIPHWSKIHERECSIVSESTRVRTMLKHVRYYCLLSSRDRSWQLGQSCYFEREEPVSGVVEH